MLNAAQLDGGGLYSLSTSVDVSKSLFEGNSAFRNGAGIALDCAAEICVGELPRDTCDVIVANLAATGFVNNDATGGDGGGLFVSNRDLAMSTTGTTFDENYARRGATVFSDSDGAVTVDGLGGDSAREVLAAVVAESNTVSEYGSGLASRSSSLAWVRPPIGGVAMPGDNLCADSGGCVITMCDDYGNVPTTPTVVNVAVTGGVLNGPQFVLVAGGFSEVIPDLSVRLVGETGALPFDNAPVAVSLQFVNDDADYDAVSMTAAQCGGGFGMVTGDDTIWCEPCVGGWFSDGLGWTACQPCPDGHATEPGTTGAVVCDWCESGFRWDVAGGSCAPCETGTFSSEVTFGVVCEPCGSGLTTSGDGASACAVAVTSGGSTPWLVGGFDL